MALDNNPEEAGSAESSAVVRRKFLRGAAVGVVAGVAGASGQANAAVRAKVPEYFAYVGSRTTKERGARGDGISVFQVDLSRGRWQQIQLVPDLVNPSYLAIDRTGQMLLAVHGDQTQISAFRIDPVSGALSMINQQDTLGINPVHVSVDPGNSFVLVANHITRGDIKSSVVVLPFDTRDGLKPVCDKIVLSGTIGPHRIEQPFPKPHQVQFDRKGGFVAVPDKGCDKIETFRLQSNGRLVASGAAPARTREGAGPRHVSFHPTRPFAYVVNELASTIESCRYSDRTGELVPFQVVSSLPEGFVGDSRASEIEVSRDGHHLYVSNRGSDTVGIFALDSHSGQVSPRKWVKVGKTPRFFVIDPSGNYLLVANEEGHSVMVFSIDAASGNLDGVGSAVPTGSPTCIVLKPVGS